MVVDHQVSATARALIRPTPSELRVCRMASAGMTNREIAQALFVSLRTVETHLTRSYAKLAVGGTRAVARNARWSGIDYGQVRSSPCAVVAAVLRCRESCRLRPAAHATREAPERLLTFRVR